MVRRRRVEPDALDVELVEVGGDEDLPPSQPTATSRPAPRRRRVLVGTGVVAVTVAGVLGLAQVAGHTPTAGVVEGRIGSVPSAPRQLWHEPGSHWAFVSGDTVVHGNGHGVTMQDLRTGDVVGQRVSEDVGDCEAWQVEPWTAAPEPVVLCTRGPEPASGASALVLTALAVRDGRTLWEHRAETEVWHATVTVLDGGGDDDGRGEEAGARATDVLWTVRDGGTIRVARLGLLDGEVRWSTTLEAPSALDGLWVDVADGSAVISGSAVVDLATGGELRPRDAAEPWAMTFHVPVPGDGTAHMSWPDRGSTLTVLEPDGTERFRVDGAEPLAWRSIVSDRADAFAVAASDGRYVALDARTGEELWQMSSTLELDALAYLPDVMILHDGTELRGVEPRTGTVIWSAPLVDAGWAHGVVDERRVVTPARLDDGHGLLALDVETGEEAWRLPLPGRARDLHAADGVLVVQMETGTVALATG